jgi:hypothetical protein
MEEEKKEPEKYTSLQILGWVALGYIIMILLFVLWLLYRYIFHIKPAIDELNFKYLKLNH